MQNIGWQSWSTKNEPEGLLYLPTFNFNPKGKVRASPPVSHVATLKKPAYGWCSWYAYGWNIDEQKILSHADWIQNNEVLPLRYVLVDGGWCLWGDWLEPDTQRFPQGIPKLTKSIKQRGLLPGIWVSPFLVHPKSRIAQNHPDWLVRKNDKLIDGFKLTPWDRLFFYKKWILDIKKKKVQEYINTVIKWLVEVCGIELLKIDFMYSIYFDPNLTEHEADEFLKSFLKNIKQQYPHVYTISSGCPLVPAVGSVDSMRVGPDSIVSPFLSFLPFAPFLNKLLHTDVVETVKKRLWTRKLWNLDPDAFVCRKNVGFSHEQILTSQQLIKECQGNIFLGDNLTILSKEHVRQYIYPLFAL